MNSKFNINISSLDVAEMVDLEAKQKQATRTKFQIAVMVGCAIITILIVVICLSVLLSEKQGNNDDTKSQILVGDGGGGDKNDIVMA